MRLAQAFQPNLANALRKSEEPRLHIRWKGGDFASDSLLRISTRQATNAYISLLR
jgi:hypothetical protein